MKTKILVVFTGPMELGGVETSLLGLLSAFDYDKVEVDLFIYGHQGPLFNRIDSRVNLLPECHQLSYLLGSFSDKIKHGCYYAAWQRLVEGIISPFHKSYYGDVWAKTMRKYVKKFDKHYDMALGFFKPFDLICEKVYADIKVGWIHTDYKAEGEDLEGLRHNYARVDYIAAVSEQCKESFVKLFPEFRDRVIVVPNILSKELILADADKLDVSQEMPDDGSIKLLSIGRFCEAKNFDNIPDICSRIIASGVDVKWYIIGFGGDEQLIRDKIAEAHMEDRVIILGKKVNPYPYIKACDVYVQPSRYEAKGMAVVEAQMLSKPVIITNYACSRSTLEDGVDGLIVPMDNEGCAEGIAEAIKDKALLRKLSENTKTRDYTQRNSVDVIMGLV